MDRKKLSIEEATDMLFDCFAETIKDLPEEKQAEAIQKAIASADNLQADEIVRLKTVIAELHQIIELARLYISPELHRRIEAALPKTEGQ